jgi:ketosteroid isomerase-like protein
MNTSHPTFIRVVVKFVALAAWCSGLLNPAVAQAEEWSAEQKEVWKNVETYWALDMAGDTAGFLAYFHADYKGWNYNNAVPGSKERATKFITHGHKSSKTLVYDLQPATVRVYGDVAFVHYFWTRVGKDAEGKEKRESGRWTDILRKQAGKWVMVADHGGAIAAKE